MIRAIIFDCFGVLLTDALEEVVSKLEKSDPDRAKRIIGIVTASNRGAIDATAARIAIATELNMTLEEYVKMLRTGEVKNVALLKYIAALRRNYATALLSNVSRGGLARRFQDGELSQYFDVIVMSGDIGFAKPEAQAYEITADRLGVRLEECIMIDDREDYCRGATSVGMQSILYKSFAQLQTDLARFL